jgi:hypothetical protein
VNWLLTTYDDKLFTGINISDKFIAGVNVLCRLYTIHTKLFGECTSWCTYVASQKPHERLSAQTRGLVCVNYVSTGRKKCIIALGVFYVAFRSTYARWHVGYACWFMPCTVKTQHSEGNGICTKIVSVFAATLPSDLWLQVFIHQPVLSSTLDAYSYVSLISPK